MAWAASPRRATQPSPVLAEGGMRALTHCVVDGAAGMPPGTTSAYPHTRKALLTAVVRRIVELDQAELESQV
nr:hypothetical protein [Streptomyces sp. ISL-10]